MGLRDGPTSAVGRVFIVDSAGVVVERPAAPTPPQERRWPGIVQRIRVAPMEDWNFLSARTFILSFAVGAIVGNFIGGPPVAIVVGLTVYVLAALHPLNVTTCRYCGEVVQPRASVCRACGSGLVELHRPV